MGEADSRTGQARQPGRGPTLFTIAHQQPFARALAAGIIARHPDPLTRARVLVLLPSARAARALGDAFLAAADGRAALLPRMAAVGNLDEDEALGRFAEGGAAAPVLPPAMPPLERLLGLAAVVGPLVPGGPAQAIAAASTLAAAMDQLAIHGVPLSALHDLAMEDMAGHWARSRAMLSAIMEAWPAIVAERELMDAVTRREALLAALTDRWAATPPPCPVYAAGFAAAPPAVARLIGVVARLPAGALVLPGFDPAMDAELVEAVRAAEGVTHPQHGMLALLDRIGAAPAEVQPWPAAGGEGREGGKARADAVALALLPPSLADRWRQAVPAVPDHGMALFTARGVEQEALAIALAMRRQLETPGATAALVTPSRPLARRVAAALGRFGLLVDDSAGEPLGRRPHGVFAGCLVAAASRRMAPVPLLALLNHPLAGGADRAQWLAMVRQLDLALRGLAPAPGVAGVTAHLERLAERAPAAHAPLLGWWKGTVAPMLAPLDSLFAAGAPALAEVVAALLAAGPLLAGEALWAGQDGRALAGLMDSIAAAPDSARIAVPAEAAVRLAGVLIDSVTVRPAWRQHPRLAIWGPLEARLQSADLMILGSMNEGQWPAEPAVDPWLAPAIARALGLPDPRARIGLMAHDLMGALAAPRLLFTRAARDADGVTTASRFLLRIEAAVGALPPDEELEAAMALDGGALPTRALRPAPAPPAAARPRRLAVTDADMLAADPFSFYAKRILRLAALDPLAMEPDAAMRGTAVHRIAERFIADPAQDPAPLIAAELARLGAGPALSILWRPRLERMIAWLAEQIGEDRAEGWTVAAAEAGARTERRGVTIEGKADRIDRNPQGRYRIIDYKTGALPSAAAFADGQARQLPLLRLMLEEGGVGGLPAGPVDALLYVKLSGGGTAGETKGKGWALDRETFTSRLDDLLGRWFHTEAAFEAKLNPVFAMHYRTYDHLARLEEWIGRG